MDRTTRDILDNEYDSASGAPAAGNHPDDIKISIKNELNNVEPIEAYVDPETPVGTIASTFMTKLGIQELTDKATFSNSRTGKSTANKGVKLNTLDFIDGDALTVNPSGIVACES